MLTVAMGVTTSSGAVVSGRELSNARIDRSVVSISAEAGDGLVHARRSEAALEGVTLSPATVSNLASVVHARRLHFSGPRPRT